MSIPPQHDRDKDSDLFQSHTPDVVLDNITPCSNPQGAWEQGDFDHRATWEQCDLCPSQQHCSDAFFPSAALHEGKLAVKAKAPSPLLLAAEASVKSSALSGH